MHACNENNWRTFKAWMIVDETRGFEAVHVRHAYVEQDHCEFLAHQFIERLHA